MPTRVRINLNTTQVTGKTFFFDIFYRNVLLITIFQICRQKYILVEVVERVDVEGEVVPGEALPGEGGGPGHLLPVEARGIRPQGAPPRPARLPALPQGGIRRTTFNIRQAAKINYKNQISLLLSLLHSF